MDAQHHIHIEAVVGVWVIGKSPAGITTMYRAGVVDPLPGWEHQLVRAYHEQLPTGPAVGKLWWIEPDGYARWTHGAQHLSGSIDYLVVLSGWGVPHKQAWALFDTRERQLMIEALTHARRDKRGFWQETQAIRDAALYLPFDAESATRPRQQHGSDHVLFDLVAMVCCVLIVLFMAQRDKNAAMRHPASQQRNMSLLRKMARMCYGAYSASGYSYSNMFEATPATMQEAKAAFENVCQRAFNSPMAGQGATVHTPQDTSRRRRS